MKTKEVERGREAGRERGAPALLSHRKETTVLLFLTEHLIIHV